MAWDVAAYGIAVAVIAVALVCVIGVVKICGSLSRVETKLELLSREATATLIQCRKLAEETNEAVVASRQSLQGFSTLAEGARALGEAAQTAAQTAAHAAAYCRERLASLNPAGEQPDLSEIGRKIWLLWKKRTATPAGSD